MKREEAIEYLKYIAREDNSHIITTADIEALETAIKALEQESKTEQFAKWVAEEIFSELWEVNHGSFAEIACRKLAKLGIVRAKGDKWELIESQESEIK